MGAEGIGARLPGDGRARPVALGRHGQPFDGCVQIVRAHRKGRRSGLDLLRASRGHRRYRRSARRSASASWIVRVVKLTWERERRDGLEVRAHAHLEQVGADDAAEVLRPGDRHVRVVTVRELVDGEHVIFVDVPMQAAREEVDARGRALGRVPPPARGERVAIPNGRMWSSPQPWAVRRLV